MNARKPKQVSVETRRLRDGMLVSSNWLDVDEALLDMAGPEWLPTRRFDFLMSDSVGY